MSLSTHHIYYRRSGVTYSVNLYTSASDFASYSSHYMPVNIGGTTYYAPMLATSDSYDSYLRAYKGEELIVKNGYSSYMVPAGTYTPSAFANLIYNVFGVNYGQQFSGYIQRTFVYRNAGTHLKQNNRYPGSGSTASSETVRLYCSGTSSGTYHYWWLTGSNWSSKYYGQWCQYARLTQTELAGIVLYFSGPSDAQGQYGGVSSNYANYPITIYQDMNVTT